MKYILIIAVVVIFSCGPSKEEKERAARVEMRDRVNKSIEKTTAITMEWVKERDRKIDSLVKIGKEHDAMLVGGEFRRKMDSLMKSESQ